MLKVVNSLFRSYLGRYRQELQRHYEDPLELQRETLKDILRRQQATAFGREHDFTALVREPERFGDRLPVRTYEEHRPYIDRVLGGEERVLTRDAPAWIATTSGTTGSTKHLPLTRHAIRNIHLRGSWLSLAALYAKRPDVHVFSSKNLLIGGAFKGLHPTLGIPQGDISAVIIQSIPRIMRPFYIPDVRLATAVDYEEKIERIARLAARETGITVLGGVPTWNLPLYRRILELHGGDNMLDVWPQAQAFKHGGVNFEPYREQFRRLFPDPDFIFQEIYNATEGFFGIQDRDDRRTMLLLLSNGIYYEFIPWSDYQSGEMSARPLSEVRAGETYVMLITTCAGLYRYPMGDLVTFTETDPYRLRILGRTQEFINAFGEDLLRSEAESALLTACQDNGALVRDFTVGPEYIELGSQGRHHWLVEFERPPADLERFNQALDEALIAVNYNYAAKRSNDFAIARHRLTVLPDGRFRRWLAAQGKLGGQHKVPRLANHRRYVDGILDDLKKG